MTVGELIEKLQKYELSLDVMTEEYEGDFFLYPIDEVRLNEGIVILS